MDAGRNYGITVLYEPKKSSETSSEPLHAVFESVVFLVA